MARKIALFESDGEVVILDEEPVRDELQMQEFLRQTPDLLPVDDFEVTGPLMVVGRETTLPSGATDLVLLAPTGDLLIVEFKTGPQNADFRSAVAQLVDYGSHLWGLSYAQFEAVVARRFFDSPSCDHPLLRGKQSLAEAAAAFWSEELSGGAESLQASLTAHLASGDFHYVLVAQRFTETMRRVLEYMNATMAARFHGVEFVGFRGNQVSAFESRALLRPASGSGRRSASVDEATFLDRVTDAEYRRALEEFFDVCRGLGLRLQWGAQGASIRVQVPDRGEPLSIAWIFPPGVSGWMGLRDLTLGCDAVSARTAPSVHGVLNEYIERISGLPGATAIQVKDMRGFRLEPKVFLSLQSQVPEVLAALVQEIGELE